MVTTQISLDFGGMSDKQVEELAAGTLKQGGYLAPPAGAGTAGLGGVWKLSSTRQVTRETLDMKAGREEREVFDFGADTRTVISRTLEPGAEPEILVEPFASVDEARIAKASSILKALSRAHASRK